MRKGRFAILQPMHLELSSSQQFFFRYEMKFTEPNGQIHVLRPVASTSSVVFKFLSSGMGTIKLGMLYSTGWITVDEINFIVQGEIKHLKFKVDNKEEYALVENQIYEFALSTSYQPYQMFR